MQRDTYYVFYNLFAQDLIYVPLRYRAVAQLTVGLQEVLRKI